jgi:predicted dehydrogenase
MNEQKYGVSRRSFLKATLAASTFTIIPAHAAPKSEKSKPNDDLPPSERVNVACCGVANQGGQDMKSVAGTGMANIVALCDVDSKNLDGAGKQFPKAAKFQDFRKMFEKMAKDIDAVTIGVPDHSHFPIAMLAMSLGKHVYVEKPLAHTFNEIELMMAAARKYKVATQMGNQGHSGGNYFQFKSWTEAGIIKNVTHVDAFMNGERRWFKYGNVTGYPPAEPMPNNIDWEVWTGTAPMHDFSKKFHPGDWRSWYIYGNGALGDWGPHILDTIHEFLDLGLPEEIIAVNRDTPNEFIFPMASTLDYKFPARGDKPAMDITWHDGVKNRPAPPPEMKDIKQGSSGKIIHSKELVFYGGTHSDILRIAPDAKMKEMIATLPKVTGKNSGHHANFLLGAKGKETCRSNFDVAGPLSQVLCLGVIAQRLGGTLQFDRATKRITNNETANAMLTGVPPRKGWEEFYKL